VGPDGVRILVCSPKAVRILAQNLLEIFSKKKWSGVRILGKKWSGPDFKDGRSILLLNENIIHISID